MLKRLIGYFTLPLLLLLAMLARGGGTQSSPAGFVSGPDVITGDMHELNQAGSSGTQVGLAVGITSCNAGNQPAHFEAMPSTNHPTVAHNLYRMSGGSGNNERFEQIGQSWVKHTYGAKPANDCGFGCTDPGTITLLGVGCSDTYFWDQSAAQPDLGSRAWINPFTGVFSPSARNHAGHSHIPTSHLILMERSELEPASNPGATYYAEVQYIVPDEGSWCQAHPGECNMDNNASYRRFNVTQSAPSFMFFPVGETVQTSPALDAWTGAIQQTIEPAPGADGRAFIAYKVTNPSAGVWHYEYAIYNQNLDRAIQSFSLPLGCGITVSNLGFHAPLNHPGFPNDGTQGNAGFSNAAWTSNQTSDALSWNTETFAQNQNANAIRWGTLYNFRFDSDRPPHGANATIGFFTTGTPITVAVQGPMPCNATPSPTPPGTAQAINLSTRMRVQTGDQAGIGGFIITGTAPKQVLLRGIGPSLGASGISGVLANPTLDLRDSNGVRILANNDWRDDPAQEALIEATGIPPTNDLEAAIVQTLAPGSYTVILRGMGMTTGVGLVEIYDLNQGVDSKLANLSTRAFIDTGNNIVIAGFILGSHSDADRIVLRGIGPSLTALGVPNALADPTLELRDSNGALLMANNDWQDDPVQVAELTAAGLAPTTPLESGISTTQPAGVYTALLSGANNGTGIGLVEVYDLGTP